MSISLELPRFDQAGVIVVGDVMLDSYWHGSASRISPEAPVPVVKVDHVEKRPGGAANVALNLASLGCPVWLLGVTGGDEDGEQLQSQLESAGIYCDFIKQDHVATISKLRVISQRQQLMRLDFEDAVNIDISLLKNQLAALLDKASVLLLSDYGKGVLADPRPLISLAKSRGIPVVVDPKGTDFSRYRGATLLTPNLAEFEAVVGSCADEAELVSKGQQLLQQLELDALLVTRSERGMTLFREKEPELHLPTHAKEVFDVTGAGDTVIATFAAALAADKTFPQAASLSNIAAGVVVSKLGTAVISLPELQRKVNIMQGAGDRGVISPEQLPMVIEEARSRGERIVFTNGCFDLLHPGHVGYLEQARKQGDRLLVALNDDDSVRRLKGAGRPINSIDRRMTVVAGLQSVDWVTCFSEDTPLELIKKIRPDVLLKGGDYTVDGVVGHEFVEGYGGEVMVLDFLDDCSTTAIVKKVQKL